MASALGTLALNLIARTDKFEKGMKGASKRMTAMQKSIGLLKKAAIGLGAAFSVRMFAGAIKGSLEMMDSIGKLSDRVGIATETLTGLRHAAALSGMDTEAFNSALERLAKNIGDVNMKSSEARYALEKLGLDAQEIANMSLDNALLMIADRFNKLGNETEQAAVVTSLFGRSGYDLINFLKLGSGGISNLIKENEELGGSFTREQAAMAEAANDAVLRMQTSWKSFSKTLAIEVAPSIEGLAIVLQDLAQTDIKKQSIFAKAFDKIVGKNSVFNWLGEKLGDAYIASFPTEQYSAWTEEELESFEKGTKAAKQQKEAIVETKKILHDNEPFRNWLKIQLDSNRYAGESIQIWHNVGKAYDNIKTKALGFFNSIQEKLPYLETMKEFKFEILSDEDKLLKNLEDKYNKYAEAISKVFAEGTDAFKNEMDKLNKWFNDEKTDIKTTQDFNYDTNLTPTSGGSLLEVGKYIDAAGLINKVDYGRQMVALQKETNKILRDQERFSVR